MTEREKDIAYRTWNQVHDAMGLRHKSIPTKPIGAAKGKFCCHLCGAGFQRGVSLAVHMAEHMDPKDKLPAGKVQCELCLTKCNDAESLFQHKAEAHSVVMNQYVDRVYEWATNKRMANQGWPFAS